MDPVRKQATVQESSGLLLANISKPIQSGSGRFTGTLLSKQLAAVGNSDGQCFFPHTEAGSQLGGGGVEGGGVSDFNKTSNTQ